MKKFMIFLLMAFLYLGTCQARSEASHPNNAKLKLLSWVSPTPSESFLTRSDAVNVEGLTISPSSTVFLSVTGDLNSQVFTANYGGGNTNVTAWKWFVDGVKVGNAQSYTYTANAMIVGTHSIYSRAILASGDSVQSPATTIIVNQNDIQVEVVGVTEACEDAEVVLTASIEGTQLQGFKYLWKYQGNVLQQGVNSVQLLNQGQQIKFYPRQLLGGQALVDPRELDFTVEVSYAGCKLELSPVHYLTVYPTPQLSLVVPEQICATGATVLTAAVTGNTNLTPYQYKWFKKAGDYISDLATTTVPELTVENDSLLNNANWEHVGVAAIYTSAACNTDTVWNQTRPTKIPAPDANALVMKHTLPNEEADTFCLGSQILFTLTDGNTAFGTPTYTWTVNGVPAEATGNMLEFVAEQEGTFYVVVSATYENYPCEVTVADTDTVVINVAPQLFISGNNVICTGGSTTLTATVSPATTIQAYEWTTPSGLANNNTNSLNANVAGVYTVKATLKSGCEVTTQFTVTQFGADLQVYASEYYACPGSTVALNANADGWVNENISYAWYKINGTNAGDTVNLGFTGPTYTATIPTNATDSVKYLVKATAADGCTLEQVIKVNLMGGPLAKISFVDAKDTTLCAGGQAVLKINDPVNTYNGNYTWYQNGIEIPGANLDSISVALNQAGVYVYSAKRANAASCGNDTVADASVTFTVVDAPAIAITGDNVICQNASATMVVAPVVAGATYTWFGPDTAAIHALAATDSALTTTIPGVYAVTMAKNGCASTAQFNITQFGGNLQVYASDLEVCPGSPVMLSAVLDGYYNENVAYKWYLNNANGTAIDSASSVVVYPELANGDSVHYVVKAYAEDADACALTSYINIYVIDTVTPQLTLNVDPATLCQGGQIAARVTTTAAINYYTWFLNGVEIPGQNLDSIRINIIEPGDYMVAVKPADNICVAHAATIAEKSVTVGVIPEITMTGNNVICNGDTAMVIAVPVPTVEGNIYKYTWAGPNTTYATDSCLKTVVPGVYTVMVENKTNGCIATADFTIYQNGGNLNLMASNTSVCANEPVQLSAHLAGFENENIVYAWSTGDTSSLITVNPTTTTTYVVTAFAGNCQMIDSVKITVGTGTIYHTTVTRHNGSEYCEGQENAYFTATTTETPVPVYYNWYLDGILIPGDNRGTLFLNDVAIGAHHLAAAAVVEGCNTSVMSSTVNFNVHAAPEVTIAGNNVICNGDTAHLTANATTMAVHPASSNVYTYKYAWNTGANTKDIKVTENGTYTVTVTNRIKLDGIWYDLCSTVATVEVNTFGGDLNVTADQTVVCAGTPVVLNANLDGFNNENVVYAWNTNDTASTITVFPTTTTTYVVNAIAGNCNMTDSIKIIVNQLPADLNVTASVENICEGGQVTLTAAPANANNANAVASASYIWYQNGVEIAGLNESAITVNLDAAGSYAFAVKGVSAYGCVASQASEADTVNVFAAPVVTLTGNNVICNGDSAEINVNVLPAADADHVYSYAWNAGVPTNAALMKTGVAGIYTVTVTNTANNLNCQTVASVNVITTGADMQIIADNTVICEGEYVTLRANFEGFVNENASYVWSDVDGNQLGNGSNLTVNPTDDTQYVLTVNAGECSISDTIDITVHERPGKASVSLSANTICAGGQVTAEVTHHSHGLSYIWYVNGQELAGENRSELTLNLDEAGDYVFQARTVNQYGCQAAQLSANSPEHTVTVVPTPQITLSGNNLICNGDSAVIVASVLPEETHGPHSDYTYEYAWSNGTDKDTLVVYAGGVYTLTVTNVARGMNCYATASVEVMTSGADMQIIADNTVICEGEYVTLRANFDGFVNENASYEWTADGDIVGNGANLTVNPDANTTYVLTVNAGNCSIADSIDITVHERPEKASVSLSANTICAGGQVTAEVTHHSHGLSYIWYVNGQELAGENRSELTLNLNEPGDYVFQARTISEYGCQAAQLPAVTPERTVTVVVTPQITLSGNNFICNGDSAVIVASVLPEETHGPHSDYRYEYAWSNGTENDTLVVYTGGVYTLTVTNVAHHGINCQATASVNVITTGADLQLVADKMEICEGEMITLNANNDGFINENVSYAWTGNGLNANEGSTVSAVPSVNESGLVKYVVTVTAGECTMIDSISIYVTKVDTFKTTVANINNVCQGGQITATATSVPVATEFVWYLNGLELPGENQPTITLNMNENGEYTLAAKAVVEGCQFAVVSAAVPFTVDSMPVVTITGNQLYTVGSTVATLTASNDYNFSSFVWSDGQTGQEITVSQYGVYTVTATTANGCVAISEPFTVSPVEDLQVHIVGPHEACQNDVVTLSAIVDYDLEGHTYQWFVDNNPISGATAAHLTINVSDLYDATQTLAHEYKVEVSVPNSGAACHVVVSPVHSFLITPVPMAVVSAPEKVCEGSDVTFEALVYAIGNNAQYQYVWYRDNENNPVDTIDYLTTYTVDFATATQHTHAVKVLYQDLACSSNISEFVGVEVYETPVAITMNLDPSTICTTNQAELTITDNNSEETFGVATYNWFVNGVEMPLVHGNLFTADFDHNGAYSFWATATYSEYPCAVLYTDTVVENVVMHPTVQITGDPIICHNDPVVLYANLNDTVGSLNYTYEWRLYNYTVGGNQASIPWPWSMLVGNEITLPDFPAYMEGAPVWVLNGESTYVSVPLPAQDYPYIFTVIVTTPEGCRVESEPYYVYVGEDPEVVATVDFDTVCAAGEITATAHLGNWNMDNLTAQWQVRTKNDDGSWSEWENIDYGTSGILHHVPGVTSQYRIIVSQTTTGCYAISAPVDVEVITPQQIDHIIAINANSAYQTNLVCEGAQLEVKALMVQLDENNDTVRDANGDIVYFANNDLTYMWKLNGMELQTIHGPEFSAQAYIYDGDPMYYVYEAYVVFDIPGCPAVPVVSDTIFVKRNPIVTIDGNQNVCYYGTNVYNIALTAWVDGIVDEDATYSWFESGQSRPNTGGYDNNYREAWPPTYDNPYIFTVEVTNGDGCTTMSDPFTVNVYERPYVNITGDATQICENGNVTLQANLDNYNDPMLTFQWYRDEVNNTHIVPGATHEVETFEPELGTTNYIVKVTHLMDWNAQYCVAYDTFPVNVVAIPEVSAVNDLNGVRTICEGRDVTMNATTTGGVAGGEVYTWYRNGELVQDVNSSIFVDSPVALNGQPTQYIYTVKVKQAASGCESNIFVIDTITVNPTPVVELVTDPIVCVDTVNNIHMTANVVPDNIATDITYHWFEDNAEIYSALNDNAYTTYRPYRDYPYSFTVRMANEYGCIAESSALVYVNASPVVNITANDTMMCVGGEVELAAALNDWNADMLTFQWYDNDVLIPGATSLNYAVVPEIGNHNYKVEIYQLTSECAATSKPITVHVVADPVIASITNNIPENNQVCDGYQVLMTANVQGGVAGGEVYTWYRNGQVIEGATAPVYTEVVSALNGEPTIYKYTVSVAQSAFGCESDVYTGMANFTVNPNPTVEIMYDPIVCVDTVNNVTLVANAYPTNETFTYRWFEDNVEIPNVTGNTYTTSKPFSENPYNFSVMLVNNIACSAVAEAHVYVNAAPVVNITVTEDDICVGGEITLAAALNDWNADMLTFQWFDDTLAIAGATSLTYTFVPAQGQHNYSLKVNQITSGCEATSNVIPVNVKPLPIVTSVVASQYDVCYGGQLTLTAHTNDNDANGGVFTWYRNGILMEGATARTINDTPGTVDNNTQTYVYTAVVTYPQAGCTSLPTNSDVVTVYPNPVVVITGDQHVCETDSIFLIANVDTTGMNVGGLHYTWYESGQIRDNMAYNLGDRNFFAEYMYARTEPYRFTVDVWRDGVEAGCVSHSAEYLVYVYPQPVVNITATETEICANGEVTLTANLNDYNADNITYQWYTVGQEQVIEAVDYNADGSYIYDTTYVNVRNYIDGATSATYTTTLDQTTTLGVMVVQTNSTCTANDEITITVHPIPVVTSVVVDVLNDTVNVCNGASVMLGASFNGYTADGAVFTWFRNGNEIVGANGPIFSENVYTTDNQVTTYHYSAIVTLPASGCVSAMSADAGVVIVNPAPSTVSISGINVICENDSTVLTAYSDVPGTFTWSNGDQGNTTTVHAGTYTVTMVTIGGCEMTSAPFTVEAFGTDLFVNATPSHICQGDHATLQVTQDGWQGNVTYQWDANAGNSTSTTVDVTPDSTTTYHVVATVNSTNGTCSVEGEVTVVVTPRPAQLTVTASETEVCEGTQVTFTATGAADAVSYIWYANGNEVPGENQAVLTVLFDQSGVYNYAAKAVNEDGCISALASEPATVTVNAAPASVTISGNAVICNGGSTVLYANVAPEAAPGTQVVYTWFKNNVAMNLASVDHITVTEAGSYKVYVSYNGCTTESEAFDVTVEQAPQLQLTATETEICVNGSTVITAEATGWNNADVNYNWNNGFQGSVYTFVPDSAAAYTFTVTASQATSGCEAVASITINVNEVPATPVVVVDNATICDGGQVTLTVTNPVAGATYTWYSNGTVISNANQATLTQSPVTVDGDATNYVYTVVAQLPNSGCVSEMSANTVVAVIPAPVAVVSVEGNTTVCDGGITTLHANVSPAGVAYNYQWYKDNMIILGATNADYVVNEAARETAYNFTVVVTANAGCNVTAAAPAITVVADPVVTLSINNDIVCVGGTATMTATVDGGVAGVNGLNGYTYEWHRNDVTGAIATTASYTTTGTEAAGSYLYWMTVTSNYGCQSNSDTVAYTVVADPTVTITVANGYDNTVCDGGATALKANVTGGYGVATYQWFKNGNLIPGETNPVLNINNLVAGTTDTYAVEVAQSGVGCNGYESVALSSLVTVAPAYTVDITGFGNVCEGGTLTLNATVNGVVNGDVLSYQWYKILNGEDALPISGANAAQYTTSDLLLGNSYDYYVVVTSTFSGCTVVSNSVPANVVPAPTVVINGATEVCEGGNLTLNAFVNGGVDGTDYVYTWNWTGAATGTATTTAPTYNVNLTASDAAAPYYFTVTISRADNTGCTATSAAHEVNILTAPAVTVTADNNYVCQNGDVTFTAHVTPVGAYNYVWTINGQQQAENAATITTSMSTVGAINATVVVSAAGASASCSGTATLAVPVQVVAAPTVTISADHLTMCVGGTTTLTANVTANGNVPGEFNYQWAINGIEVQGAVANTFVQPLNAAGVYTYTLRVSQNNNLGCNSAWSAPVTVQVAEQPVVTLSSQDGLSICEGGSVTLNAAVTNYSNNVNGVTNSNIYGTMTYNWFRNGVSVDQQTAGAMNVQTYTLNTIGNYDYQVSVNAAGYNCQPQMSNIETVQVVGNPSWTDVHVIANNGTDVCLGEMVILQASIQGGTTDGEGSTSGHIQWVVTDANGNTVNVNGGLGGNSYDIPAAAGSYIYTPTYLGNIGSGCQLTNTGDVQVGVTVHELPTATFTSGDGTALCSNDPSASAELVISFTGVAPFVYEVVDNHGNVIAHATTLANTASVYVAPTTQTTYRINLVQDAYCENTALDANATATVYVNDIQFDETFFVAACGTNTVTIEFNMISGNPAANFTVTYSNGQVETGTISNNTATFATPTAPGDYNAVFTVDGCSYDITVRVPMGGANYTGTLPLMDQRWNDVVVVNCNPATNGGHTFIGFQWYHNGVAIPGATYSNYQDKDGLNGFYSVELIEQDANGNMVTYITCDQYFNAVSTVKVYPVPANVRQEITIELDLTSEELEGAVLDIFSVTGAHINHVVDLQPITKIEGFKAQGTYFGRILTGTNEIKTVKFVIVK